ncbi:MAG: hypothetical protein H0T66_14390 [Geodermatophilaceae bacterium]|nr:hypothetical protein [Geodermatophilaceae bacterium]
MTDLDLSDLLDSDLTDDDVLAELAARLGIPAVHELWGRDEFGAMIAATSWIAHEKERIARAVLTEMIEAHLGEALTS